MITIQVFKQGVESEESEWLGVYALLEGFVIGACQVTGWKSECPCLVGLFVEPERRRHGVGTAIAKMCIEQSRVAGKSALSLTVNKKNESAERLYRRLGFRVFSDDDKNRWMSLPLIP